MTGSHACNWEARSVCFTSRPSEVHWSRHQPTMCEFEEAARGTLLLPTQHRPQYWGHFHEGRTPDWAQGMDDMQDEYDELLDDDGDGQDGWE